MGNSLHNKIYLGRRNLAVLSTKRAQAMICVAAFATIALVWLLIRTF